MPSHPDTSIAELAAALRAEAELARTLSAIERGELTEAGDLAASGDLGANVIGIVGAPGVGKSTLIGALIREIRKSGQTVAVLAVDPSSPVSGGAFLGDRVRMAEHAQDRGVFFRSFAGRGGAGGLADAIPGAVRAVRAAGWGTVIIEPIGGGQADVAIAQLASTMVLVLSPESGDEMQIMKAGILELADVVVVNKADRPGASQLHSALRSRWSTGPRRSTLLVAATSADGVPELWALLQEGRHRRAGAAATRHGRREDTEGSERNAGQGEGTAVTDDLSTDARGELRQERVGGVAVVTINRPDKANTLTPQLAQLLAAEVQRAGSDPAVRVLVITGTGRAFCGGFDLDQVGRGVDERSITELMAAIRDSAVPTVAALNGAAVGAGLELACSCDLRVARPGARIGLPAVRIGVAYRVDGLRSILHAVGGRAAELLLTGCLLTAGECQGFARLAIDEEPIVIARDMAAQMAAASWPAVSYTTRALRSLRASGPISEFDAERTEIMHGPDIAEAARARAEGREPAFMSRSAAGASG